MTAVLHVVSEAGRTGQPAALHVIAQAMRETDGRAMLLGGKAMAHAAVAAGMAGWERLPPDRPIPVARHLDLRRALRAHAPVGEIHCWSTQLAPVLRLFVRATPTRVIRRTLGPDLPVEPALLDADRSALRGSWNASNRRAVVALLSDHPEEGDAYEAAMAVGLCEEALQARDPARQVSLLLHPDQRHGSAAHRMFHNGGRPASAIQDPRLAMPWRVVAGCDAALVLGDTAGLAATWAVIAGVPLIAEQSLATEALATHHPSAEIHLVKPGDLRTLSHHLTEVLGSPAPVAGP